VQVEDAGDEARVGDRFGGRYQPCEVFPADLEVLETTIVEQLINEFERYTPALTSVATTTRCSYNYSRVSVSGYRRDSGSTLITYQRSGSRFPFVRIS
jgi:hypothetical protein